MSDMFHLDGKRREAVVDARKARSQASCSCAMASAALRTASGIVAGCACKKTEAKTKKPVRLWLVGTRQSDDSINNLPSVVLSLER